MKIFSWMRNKRNRKDGTTKPTPELMSYQTMHRPNCDQEFSDWPNGLLAIGTFGDCNLKNDSGAQVHHDNTTTPEDFEEVDQMLRLMLSKQISPEESGKHSLSAEKFLESLREAEKEADVGDDDDDDDDESKSKLQSIVQKGSGRDHVLSDTKKSGISKKSLSFLLNKVLLCRGGFVPTAKDPLMYPKSDNPRLEKIFRAMLNKKIYPQRPNPKSTSRKYLDMPETESDDEGNEEANHKSKWVKTDSEYIVLEI